MNVETVVKAQWFISCGQLTFSEIFGNWTFNCASEIIDHHSPSLASKRANLEEISLPKHISLGTCHIPLCDLEVIYAK